MINAASSSGVNPHIKDRVRLVKGMVENKKVQADVLRSGKVDTIVSEPIGVMILHERMVRRASCVRRQGSGVRRPLSINHTPIEERRANSLLSFKSDAAEETLN